ncbi:MAG TPA: acyltransferase family protein, partial [Terriglobales bacterium]|nr:acyltransferase family protein [Terriglobales bacterium]
MDGLRFAAIGMVILFHLNGYLTAKSPFYSAAPPHSDWLAQAAMVGFRGVELFFVISGFILGLPFAAHYLKGAAPVSLRKYYLRRLTRLEPP